MDSCTFVFAVILVISPSCVIGQALDRDLFDLDKRDMDKVKVGSYRNRKTHLIGIPGFVYDGWYGRICFEEDFMTDYENEAEVLCDMYGYRNGEMVPIPITQTVTTENIWLHNVNCATSKLSHILKCEYDILNSTTGCTHDLALECSSKKSEFWGNVIGGSVGGGIVLICLIIYILVKCDLCDCCCSGYSSYNRRCRGDDCCEDKCGNCKSQCEDCRDDCCDRHVSYTDCSTIRSCCFCVRRRKMNELRKQFREDSERKEREREEEHRQEKEREEEANRGREIRDEQLSIANSSGEDNKSRQSPVPSVHSQMERRLSDLNRTDQNMTTTRTLSDPSILRRPRPGALPPIDIDSTPRRPPSPPRPPPPPPLPPAPVYPTDWENDTSDMPPPPAYGDIYKTDGDQTDRKE